MKDEIAELREINARLEKLALESAAVAAELKAIAETAKRAVAVLEELREALGRLAPEATP